MDFTTKAEWYDTSLRYTYYLHIGHFCIHSLETSTLSSLLLADPFDLNHVYFLPTIGKFNKKFVSMKLLKPLISLDWSPVTQPVLEMPL